jgi:hypothetical protein
MFGEDFKNCRRFVNKETTRTYYNLEEGEKYPSKKLPIAERWSARKFDIKTVFSQVNEADSKRHEVEWFWDVGTWEGYRQYLASNNFIQRPSNNLTAPHKHSILCSTQEVLK